ncbi:MAG: hypothetical protein ACRCYE_04815 [Sarcina sp.]
MDYKKNRFFPGIEFKENLYIGFKEDTFSTYQKIIENLKEKNYEFEEVNFEGTIGFKFDTSFVSIEPIKNKNIEEILETLVIK